MPSDTYTLTISDAGVSVPSSHASSHITGGSDVIPTATSSASGLMSPAIFTQHGINTAKVSNATHTGDVTDASGVLTVDGINGVELAPLGTGILRLANGVPSIATEGQFPTLNQSTTGNANTATTATNLAGGAIGAVPYQTGSGATAMLSAGTAGRVLKANGSAAPSWAQVNISSETTGTLPVASGGSGATTFTVGVLKANGTSAFTTVAAPSGDLVGTTDIQTLTNKTLGNGTSFSAPIGVAFGGTGEATFTAGVLKANGANNFTTVSAPTGDIVGTTDIQTITNKTFGSGTVFSSVIGASSGGTGISSFTVGDIIYADTSTSLAKLPDVATGSALISGGVGAAPTYGKIGLTTHVSGTLPVANGGTGVTTSTGSGANVFATSPVLVTPQLGTPTSGTLTSCTGLPLTTGVTGTLPVANGGTGVTTSIGSGANVLATSPTLVTPALGTPTSGTLTSCTGLPLTTGVTGTLPVANGGTGVTAASTGSGGVVLSTSPTLVTPILGTPTSGTLTSCTGLPLTTGVTGTLPVANGGTGYGSSGIGTLSFDTTPDTGTALTEGQLRWNELDKTLDLKMAGADVVQQIGEELLMRVHASTTISNGQVVYISGQNNGIPSVSLASANSLTARKTLGIATEDITSGSDGYITLNGLVRGLNLSSYSEGQELWLANSGNFTGTEAAYPDFKVRIGFVVIADAVEGTFYVAPKFFENGYVNGTGKIGYLTGAGGAVTQLTSKTTSVTLNKTTGQITMNNAGLANDTTVSFTLNNSKIEAGDVLILNHISGGTNFGSYLLNARTAAGSAIIDVRNIVNTNTTLSEAIVIAFAVIKSVTS